MDDQDRGLTVLRAQIQTAKRQLERAEAKLAAAMTVSPGVARAVASALDDLRAVGKRMITLEHTVNEQIGEVPPTMECHRCQAEMIATATRCARCSQPVAKA